MAAEPDWTLSARSFVATGQVTHLDEAIRLCSDPAVREFLRRPDVREAAQVPEGSFLPLADKLRSGGHESEAAIITMLGLRVVALLADQPERMDEQARNLTKRACEHAVALSRQHGFVECEACFSHALGTHHMKLHSWPEALAPLNCAIALRRHLAGREPETYRPCLAGTLNHLGNVLKSERKFPEARAAYTEAVNIRRDLAEKNPDSNRPELATALNNLGNLLREERRFPEAREAYGEALCIFRELAERDPLAHRPNVAMVLHNLAALLSEQGLFSEARDACKEAVGIYRDFAEREPYVYRAYLARALTNLGDLRQREGQSPEARDAYIEALDIYRDLVKREPHIYRPDMAMTLKNLGAVLQEQHQLPKAHEACTEALGIYRDLAKRDPHIYSPDVAATLYGLGVVLHEERRFREAREASMEALAICRELAKREPRVYRPSLAAILNRLGNTLRAERKFPEARAAYEEALSIQRTLAEREPNIYRAEVAMTLNNLGNVLHDEQRLAEAYRACDEALRIFRDLSTAYPHMYPSYVAGTLNSLSEILRDQRRFPEARDACAEALGIYGDLAKREPHIYRRHVAMTMNNLGNVLTQERRFPEASGVYDKAVSTYRDLARSEPHIYRPYVATALTNFGAALCERLRPREACDAYEEALCIYRDLGEREPHIYRPALARTLSNFGNILRKDRRFAEARDACNGSLHIYRDLARREPHIYRSDVAKALENLGNVFQEEQQFPQARAAYQEALDIRRELAEREPRVYCPDLAKTLSNLGNTLEELNLEAEARKASEEAVRAAEADTERTATQFLAKGQVEPAYQRLLAAQAGDEDREAVFRSAAAMREGNVRAFGSNTTDGLGEANRQLARVSETTGREIHILIAQTLTRKRTFLGVLTPDNLDYAVLGYAGTFGESADALFSKIQQDLQKRDPPPYPESRRLLAQLGSAAWARLPDFVRGTLDPGARHAVLTSGDTYWNAFPWEALCFGDDEEGLLGLHRPLVRWGPITTPALARLRPATFGDDNSLAAVIISPWNVAGETQLPGAREEAQRAATTLAQAGYHLEPSGKALLGDEATRRALEAALERPLAVLHYTGHGSIIGNEQVLVLCAEDAKGSFWAPFGRTELLHLRERLGRTNGLLSSGPLVLLNSCLTGRTRGFGGQREDLAGALLEQGAKAVIASPMPVFDAMGRLLGELLYKDYFLSEPDMARAFMAARAAVEWAFRKAQSPIWPAWTLMHYHGNPFACLPHAPPAGAEPGRGLVARVAQLLKDTLGLRDLAEAEEALAEIRARMQ